MRPADTTSLEQEVHGTPAGWDPKKFAFQRVRPSIIHDTRNFAECIIAAGDISEGKACLSVYLSLLPKDLASEATSKGKDGFALAPEKDDPHKLVTALRGCMNVAGEWAGALFCLSDFLSSIPPELVEDAVGMAQKHPVFDFDLHRTHIVSNSHTLSLCIEQAKDEADGDKCLGAFLASIPEAMEQRAVSVALAAPPPLGAPQLPIAVGHAFARCEARAVSRDAAVFCLGSFLNHLPTQQVQRGFAIASQLRKDPPAAPPIQPSMPPLPPTERSKTYWDDRDADRETPLHNIGLAGKSHVST